MSVNIDISQVLGQLSKISEATKNHLVEKTSQATGNLLNESQRATPKDTGELQQKHRMSVDIKGSKIEGRVEAYAEHAVYVHEGTGIYARNGNGRKTPWGYTVKSNRSKYQGFHWTRGNKPQPWLENTLKENRDNVVRMYRGVVTNR